MTPSLTSLFRRRTALFLAQEHVKLSQYFRYPCVVYYDGEPSVVFTPAQMQAKLATYWFLFQQQGITRIEPKLVALSPCRNHRQSAWIEWLHFDSSGQKVSSNQCRYMLSIRPGEDSPKVEMMENRPFALMADLLGRQLQRSA